MCHAVQASEEEERLGLAPERSASKRRFTGEDLPPKAPPAPARTGPGAALVRVCCTLSPSCPLRCMFPVTYPSRAEANQSMTWEKTACGLLTPTPAHPAHPTDELPGCAS